MSVFFKKYLFLVAAALALAAGYYYASKDTTSSSTYISLVQKSLLEQVGQTQQEMQQVLDSIPTSSTRPFTTLVGDEDCPGFLYKDSTLLAWSGYRYALDFSKLLLSQSDIQALSTTQGKFLLLMKQKEAGGSLYTLYTLLPLYSLVNNTHTQLYSGYNPAIFPTIPNDLCLNATLESAAVRGPAGQVLFYLDPPHESLYSGRTVPIQTQLLISLAILWLGVQVILFMRWPHNRHRYGIGLLSLLVYFIVARGSMLHFAIPFAFIKGKVFNPQQYTVSSLTPSLGDLLLNCLCMVVVLVYINSTYYRTETYRQLTRSGRAFQVLISILILLVSYVTFYNCYHEFSHIYEQSYVSLDITQSITFNSIKIAAVLIFIFLSCGYFLVTHLIMSVYIRINPDRWAGLGILAGSSLLTFLTGWLLSVPFEWIFLVHVAYILILYLTYLPRSFYGFRYPTTVYYLIGALTCALLATFVVNSQERKRDVQTKKKFARQVISNNDLFAEFLLKENSKLINRDTLIQSMLSGNTPLAPEIIKQRIKTLLIDHYLDQYDIEILPFDRNGTSLYRNSMAQKYKSLLQQYHRPEYATSNPALFLVNEPAEGVSRQYVSFVPIRNDSIHVGYVVLDLNLKIQTPPLRYPELILDENLVFAPGTANFSYAVFENGRRVSNYGPYNYEQKLPGAVLRDSLLYEEGLTTGGYWHIGMKAAHKRQIVVSSPTWGWKGIMANFSFLYLILVIVVSLTITGHALHYRLSSQRLTYATKIQVMLNAAFILPLLIVMFFILKIIENHYQENQQESQLDNTRNIALNVAGFVNNFQQGKMSKAYLEQQLLQIAHDSDLDINLYDTTGRLLLSSKPLLYETGLLSGLINPLAQRHIVEQKENQTLLEETLGNKTYNTTYVGLKTYDQKLLGVLSIPFFDARPNLDRQIIDIVASVLIVFTAMLLVFLLVSYLAANLLINPLRVLTRKISTTTLDQPNEPLPWQSNDEIGTLIKKYNQMLVNLESKKQVISNNEKQSAWREMARQVAHEIKNPLTPMKLTLQQLQRTIRRDDPQALEKVGRAMETVIEQIDNISYIAQSFSDIARMPPPQTELFEITGLANSTFETYKAKQTEDERTMYHKEIQEGPLYVNGDRQQFATSISSLIQNARQSIPEGRPGEITLRLYAHNESILIEIQDNGSGIPQNIRSRVFLPNFSTREGGTGLNLAMAKRIIEYAGGSIWFETEEGKGTTFYFSVPLVKA